MNSFFDDDFFNKKMLNKIKKEIKENQVARTVRELNEFFDRREVCAKKLRVKEKVEKWKAEKMKMDN